MLFSLLRLSCRKSGRKTTMQQQQQFGVTALCELTIFVSAP